eukprot:5367703-Prymnesium_polylepis.2
MQMYHHPGQPATLQHARAPPACLVPLYRKLKMNANKLFQDPTNETPPRASNCVSAGPRK